MTEAELAGHGTAARRSRLTAERERELYDAVLDLLREVGYEALTMDAVAARTRSSKATLYRQWKGKPELVAQALRHVKPMCLSEVHTGSLRGDLLEFVRGIGATAERDAALLRGLGLAMCNNPELQRALHELLVQPEIDAFKVLLQRAARSGEIDADAAAVEFIPHMLLGAVHARPLIEDRPADVEYLTRFMHAVIFPALRMT